MIISLSDAIFVHLREHFPEINLWLRQYNGKQTNRERFEKGYWFQGSNYIFIGLVNRSDTLHHTKQVGLVFDFNRAHQLRTYVAIVFRSEQERRFIKCYGDIVALGGFEQIRNDNLHHKFYDDGGIDTSDFDEVVKKSIKVLDLFFGKEGDWKKIVECMKMNNVLEELTIPLDTYKGRLNAVEERRKTTLERHQKLIGQGCVME